MDGAVVIRIVGMRRGRDLERPGGKRGRVGNASVNRSVRQSGPAGGQVLVVLVGQAVLNRHGAGDIGEWGRGIATGENRRQNRIRGIAGGTQLISVGVRVASGGLARQEKVGPGSSVWLDDALGKQIRNALAMTRLVGCKYVVEGAVLSDDDDHVLDGSSGRMLVVISSRG